MAARRDHMRSINVTSVRTHPPDFSGEGNLIPRNAVVFMFSDIFYLIQMENFVIVGFERNGPILNAFRALAIA